jgi:hypothetical protein
VSYVQADGAPFPNTQSGQLFKSDEEGVFVVHTNGSVLISRVP